MLIGLPSADVIWGATLSMTNESTDPDYAVENAQNNQPMDTARATGTSTVVTVAVASSTPVVAAVANTNATTMAIANGAGLNESIVDPPRTADGKQRNGWVDLTGLPNRTATSFTFTMSKTGSEVLEFGRLVLLTAYYDIPVVWEAAGEARFGERRPGEVENVTRLGQTWRRTSPVGAPRFMRGQVVDSAYFDILRQLHAENRGLDRGFFFAPYADENDWWFAQLTIEELTWSDRSHASTVIMVNVDEICMGLPPDLG